MCIINLITANHVTPFFYVAFQIIGKYQAYGVISEFPSGMLPLDILHPIALSQLFYYYALLVMRKILVQSNISLC